MSRKQFVLLVVLVIAGFGLSLFLRSTRPVGTYAGDAGTAIDVMEDAGSPALETQAADVTLIQFTDYQCGACRRSHRALKAALARDGRVRVVYKDWPIFGERSRHAARVALASSYQGLYPKVHDGLMEAPNVDEVTMRRVVEQAGGNWHRLLKDLAQHRAEIDARLSRNATQAFGLGLGGTPGYLVGPYLVRGGLKEAEFAKAFDQARRRSGLAR